MGAKSSQDATVATYYAGIQFVLGHGPFDKVDLITVDEKEAWAGSNTGGELTINAPELFGGKAREGGITGKVNINMGLPAQTKDSYLESVLGSAIPTFRGLVTAVAKQVYLGNNYYLKPWAFRATRIHLLDKGVTQWQDALSEPVSGLINAVHFLRECLTNTTWGQGHSAALMDETSWAAAAQTCYDEGLAFGWYWVGTPELPDFIDEIKKHIQAAIYRDRTDGKFYINLTRKVTTTTGLTLLDEDNIKKIAEFKRKSIGELASTVTVKFTDNSTGKSNSVTVSDLALYQRQSTPVIKNITYSGVTSPEMAQKLALRDLHQLSIPVYSCTITCNRDAEDLNIGDAFLLHWPEAIADTLVMRVLSINLGTATNQAITIECVQDMFSAADVVYTAPATSAWVDPISAPVACDNRLLNEAPYYLVAVKEGDAFAQDVASTDTFMVMAAASPVPSAVSASLYTSTSSSYTRTGTLDFCFTGLLQSGIDKVATSITVYDEIDLELLTTGHFIQIDSELLEVTDITDSTLTVVRGVLDTVPAAHIADARVWGWHDFYTSDKITYLTGETVNVKLATVTPKGELALVSAPVDSKTLTGRMHLPYPPGNLEINSSYWPLTVEASDIVLTWASRNRFQQTAGLIGYYTGNITTEPTVTYSGDLVRTDTSASLASFSSEAGLTKTLSLLTPLAGAVTSITKAGTTATVLMSAAHGIATGRSVKISGASDSLYNGSFIVTVIDTTSFSYEMAGTPVSDASGTLVAEVNSYVGEVELEIWSVNPNGDSLQRVNHVFDLL